MLRERLGRIESSLRSPKGHQVMTFGVFLCIAAVLWAVLAFNEEVQRDVRFTVRVVNVPDSVTLVSELPEAVNASVRAKGTLIAKHDYSGSHVINIDFRTYSLDGRLSLGSTELRGLVRSRIGSGASVLAVSPDSINLWYTSRPGVKLPLYVDAKVTTAPQYTLSAPISASLDSVRVYSVAPLREEIDCIYTEPIRYDGIDHADSVKVHLIAPPNTRVIPSEVTVKLPVEPLISKRVKVQVWTEGVPQGMKMTTFPALVEVTYLVPMSLYGKVEPVFDVVADYTDAPTGAAGRRHRLPLTLRNYPVEFQSVLLATDSVDYVLEH